MSARCESSRRQSVMVLASQTGWSLALCADGLPPRPCVICNETTNHAFLWREDETIEAFSLCTLHLIEYGLMMERPHRLPTAVVPVWADDAPVDHEFLN